MKFSSLKNIFPSIPNALLALLSAILLILSFPDFDFWFLAWFALIPLFWAIEREKEFWRKTFFLGWIFGTTFFFGSCWWLTYAPITYAAFPWILAYVLMLGVCLVAGFFPAIFAALFSVLLKRFGSYAIFAAPFLWTATEFLRLFVTGNNWNAIGYSQAFNPFRVLASYGGVLLVSFMCVSFNAFYGIGALKRTKFSGWFAILPQFVLIFALLANDTSVRFDSPDDINVIAVQPNVPMSGIKYDDWTRLRERHVQLAESELQKQRTTDKGQRTVVIFPESPMIFLYSEDEEFRRFLTEFTMRNNVSVVFNAAEPDGASKRNFNSAVMVNPNGAKIAQYDKIHLLPFGEFQPLPDFIASEIPAFVGTFSFGSEYDLMPFGEAKGGVMICFESHFGSLSREYAQRGADFLIEMTNDGYLGNTPVLRQHLANSVFRAVETNRPLLRVTNVGITTFIDADGVVKNPAEVYTEATRSWKIYKSDGRQTFYVRGGEWLAWLCSIASLALLFWSYFKKQPQIHTDNL